jgi:hypothetical protein
MPPAPPIDLRTSDDVVRQIRSLLLSYPSEVLPRDLSPDKGVSRALIEIFGRFTGLIIERLNQVPDKNLLAFLDLIGASLLPPQPARVPLTFSLVNGSIVDGLVPAGTQVAAVQAEGERAPVVFETEKELVVTAAQLLSLFVRRPDQDKYADYSALINSITADDVPAFLGNRRLEYLFYLGHDTLFSYSDLRKLQVKFQTTKPSQTPFQAQWEMWDGQQWTTIPVSLTDGGTATAAAEQYLTSNGQVFFQGLGPLPSHTIAGFEKSWLRCRLLTPITPGRDAVAGMVVNDQLPELTSIEMTATIGTLADKPMLVDSAFNNMMQLDTSKDFFPFGERPKIGDTLYLSNDKAFSQQGAVVTISISLSDGPAVSKAPVVVWEFWNGATWIPFVKPADKTNAFTKKGDVTLTFSDPPIATTINGVTSFWIRVRITSGNYGAEARFELKDENDPSKGYILIPSTLRPPSISSCTVGYSLIKSSATALVLSFNDDFEYEIHSAPFRPFKPFQRKTDLEPTLYLGFTLPPGLKTFPNRKISFYTALVEFKQGEDLIPLSPGSSRRATQDPKAGPVAHKFIVTNPSTQPAVYSCAAQGNRWSASVDDEISLAPGQAKELIVRVTIPDDQKGIVSDSGFLTLTQKSAPAIEYSAVFITHVGQLPASEQPELVWEYSSETSWSKLAVRDYSENLAKPGLVEFLAPPDFKERREFGLQRYWLRAVWNSGEYAFDPRLRGLLLNTTMAMQGVTIKDEVLGSSNASDSQQFNTIRSPILAGPQLYVREPEFPPANELSQIENDQTGPLLQTVTDTAGHAKEIWVRWDQRPDFYGSGPRDRHYVLDNQTGEVRFGDGQNGLIPPAGTGNIRMSLYRTGGGAVGNKPAGAISQLKTTVPYVQKVGNFLAATGGSEAETTDSLLKRAPRAFRHGDRAVTLKDYEDLALLASTEVARARCIPLTNVMVDDNPGGQKTIQAGTVSLIIVPRSTDPKSAPSLELLGRVQEFIGSRQDPLVELVLAGPKYVAINVEVHVTPVSFDGAEEIKLIIAQTISGYLHPLTGGMDGAGWDFGRYPHESNLFALVEGLAGVDHVNTLTLVPDKDSPEVKKAGAYFLVYSGTHTINLKS